MKTIRRTLNMIKKILPRSAMSVSLMVGSTILLAGSSYGQTLTLTWSVPGGSYDRSWAAGRESGGTLLYVCRANYMGGIHPGKVVAGKCNIGYGGQEIVLPSFEVLKSPIANAEVWQVGFEPGAANAIAGHEADGTPLFICRAPFNNGVHPGKVVAGKCNVGYGGREVEISSFEILRSAQASPNDHIVTITGSYKHNSPMGQWSRGMTTTMYCGNSPESWVRGKAVFDPSSGNLTLTIQLETDSASAGPKGRVSAVFRDGNGTSVATATSDEIGTGGKGGGSAAIRNYTSHKTIPLDASKQVRSIYLDAQCTGSVDRMLNLPFGAVEDAFKIAVAIGSSL